MGSYMISDDVMTGECYEQLLEALKGVYVTHALHNLAMERMEYTGFCEDFDEVPLGGTPPCYALMVMETDGKVYGEWTKV